MIEEILKAIAALPKTHPLVVAIDGRCASGKTTLAVCLQQRLQCPLFSLDDFFLRPFQRTPQRLAQPGGNVDYQRFAQEVLLPWRKGEFFSYRPYDCHTQDWKKPISVRPGALAIAEGSYSCHPALWELSDLHIFLTLDPAVQQKRIEARNGLEGWKVFQSRWIPLEERYFKAYSLAKRCELSFDTTHSRLSEL